MAICVRILRTPVIPRTIRTQSGYHCMPHPTTVRTRPYRTAPHPDTPRSGHTTPQLHPDALRPRYNMPKPHHDAPHPRHIAPRPRPDAPRPGHAVRWPHRSVDDMAVSRHSTGLVAHWPRKRLAWCVSRLRECHNCAASKYWPWGSPEFQRSARPIPACAKIMALS